MDPARDRYTRINPELLLIGYFKAGLYKVRMLEEQLTQPLGQRLYELESRVAVPEIPRLL
jgi:hypothetical protein